MCRADVDKVVVLGMMVGPTGLQLLPVAEPALIAAIAAAVAVSLSLSLSLSGSCIWTRIAATIVIK